jgi:hypothetical protein
MNTTDEARGKENNPVDMRVMASMWPCGLMIYKENLLLRLFQETSDVLILGT